MKFVQWRFHLKKITILVWVKTDLLLLNLYHRRIMNQLKPSYTDINLYMMAFFFQIASVDVCKQIMNFAKSRMIFLRTILIMEWIDRENGKTIAYLLDDFHRKGLLTKCSLY